MKTTYKTIQKSQPLIIGNNALNINNNDFYCTVRESYMKMINHENADLIDILPTLNFFIPFTTSSIYCSVSITP